MIRCIALADRNPKQSFASRIDQLAARGASAAGDSVLGVAVGALMVLLAVGGRRSSAALRLLLRGKARAFARGAAAAAVKGRGGGGGLPLEGACFFSSPPRSWSRAFLSSSVRLPSPEPRRRREERACLRGESE